MSDAIFNAAALQEHRRVKAELRTAQVEIARLRTVVQRLADLGDLGAEEALSTPIPENAVAELVAFAKDIADKPFSAPHEIDHVSLARGWDHIQARAEKLVAPFQGGE